MNDSAVIHLMTRFTLEPWPVTFPYSGGQLVEFGEGIPPLF